MPKSTTNRVGLYDRPYGNPGQVRGPPPTPQTRRFVLLLVGSAGGNALERVTGVTKKENVRFLDGFDSTNFFWGCVDLKARKPLKRFVLAGEISARFWLKTVKAT